MIIFFIIYLYIREHHTKMDIVVNNFVTFFYYLGIYIIV